MRGARGDAARRAEAAQATTSQSAFGDYVKFDDMFGASCIFTTGDPEQVQRQREAYVQQTMARKMYGYVHRLETHGAPIQRVVVGGGCEAAENKGGFPTSRPRDETAGALHADALANDDPLASRKRARVAGNNVGGRAGGVSPAARGGVAPQWGARALDGPGARLGTDGSLANLFEQSLGEDWEPMDPLWAAMDSLATPGSVGGGGGPLEDPCSALLPGALSKGAATEEDLMRRARIELIEERLHSLEHAMASERAPKRSDTAAGAGGSGGSDKSNAFVRSGDVPESGTRARGGLRDDVVELSPATNLFQRGLFVDTGREKKASGRSSGDASDKSGGGGSGVGGKSPQSPSPLHRAPPDRSRSRSRSDERGTAHTRPNVSARWNEAAHFGISEPIPMAVSGGATPSAEFPEVVPDDGAFAGGAFAGGFAGDGGDGGAPREPHKVSTSFTSTPGGARGGAPGSGPRGADVGGGESPRSAARRLARENAALAEERRRAKQERDVLLAEHEHNKAQAALLQASNAQYERRVAQLEALVRENTHSRPISFARTNTLARAAEEARGETVARRLGVIETFVPDEALVERVERSSFEKNVSDGRPGEPASFETEKIETRAAEDVAEKTSSGVEGVMSG